MDTIHTGKVNGLALSKSFRQFSGHIANGVLQLDPQRFLQILHLPIRAMRIVTDPIVDSVMYIVASVLLPLIARIFYRIANLLFFGVLFFISVVFGQQRADKAVEVTSAAVRIYLSLASRPFPHPVHSIPVLTSSRTSRWNSYSHGVRFRRPQHPFRPRIPTPLCSPSKPRLWMQRNRTLLRWERRSELAVTRSGRPGHTWLLGMEPRRKFLPSPSVMSS